MGIFHIKNFTRYDTRDLESLFEYVEYVLQQKGMSIDRQYVYPWKKEGGKISPIVVIKETRPKQLYRTDYSDREAATSSGVRLYCDSYFRRVGSNILLVSPDILFDTPMEAIANCGNVSIVPNEAVRSWCRRISFLYEGVFRWSNTKDMIDFPLGVKYPTVRILRKSANTPALSDKNNDVRRAIRDCAVDLRITLSAVIKDENRAQKYSEQIAKKVSNNPNLGDVVLEQIREDVLSLLTFSTDIEKRLQHFLESTEETLPEPYLEREGG